MELGFAQSGVLAPAEAVLVAPRKWVKRGLGGGNYNVTKFPLIKVRRFLQKDFEWQSQPLLLWKKKTDIKSKCWTGCLRAGRGCVIVTTNHFTHVSTSKSWDLEKDIAFHFDWEINKIHKTNKYDNWQLLFDLMWQSLNSTYCAMCMRLRGNYLSGNPAHQSRQKQNISRPSVYTYVCVC